MAIKSCYDALKIEVFMTKKRTIRFVFLFWLSDNLASHKLYNQSPTSDISNERVRLNSNMIINTTLETFLTPYIIIEMVFCDTKADINELKSKDSSSRFADLSLIIFIIYLLMHST